MGLIMIDIESKNKVILTSNILKERKMFVVESPGNFCKDLWKISVSTDKRKVN
jgi:hypothetical protein